MKKNIIYFLKSIILAILIICIVLKVNNIQNPKYFYDNLWPTSATYTGFYQIPKNSADVLFLGSSHTAAGFIPQELYNNYGITSYNLGCEQQNLLVSYYWLKEALNFQSPKAVILDTYMLHTYKAEEPLNTSEPCTRKAIDYMHWGKAKIEAINAIASNDPNQSLWSYYLTNIRFHSRWTSLQADDFLSSDLSNHCELKGYAPLLYQRRADLSYLPFTQDDSVVGIEFVPLMEEYLDKIVQLCTNNNIQLILVKTLARTQTQAKSKAINAYAQNHNIPFIDFNEVTLYDKAKLVFLEDMADGEHLNLSGSQKTTNYIGNILTTDYGLISHTETAWEETNAYFLTIQDEYTLPREDDLIQYLNRINNSNYSIFISAKDDAVFALNDEIIEAIRKLGFKFDLADHFRSSYFAIKTPNFQIEKISDESLSQSGTLKNGELIYSIESAGYGCGNSSSIMLNNTEYSKNCRGLNFVIYDNIRKRVIDSVNFDTHDPAFPATR